MSESVSIILPVYNEGENIADTISILDKVMRYNNREYEIIIVESGSTDNSKDIIDILFKEYKNLKVFYQGSKKGYGNAIREGFSKAKNELVLYTDPDKPFDFNDLPKFLNQIRDYDALIGYRVNKKIPLMRKIYSLGFKVANKIFFGINNIKDINFSFKIIRKDILEKLNLITSGWYIDGEILIELIKNNAKINQVPVNYTLREKGNSNVSFRTVFGIAKEMYWYKKQQKLYK